MDYGIGVPWSAQMDDDVRVELWTFARGDRVRVTDGVDKDRFGKVVSVHGCSIANTDEHCRDHCRNVYVTDIAPGPEEVGGVLFRRAKDFMVEPGKLEHCD